MTTEPYVTADEVAAHLKITRRQVLEMTRKGIIPAYPLGVGEYRRVWRFKISEVEAAIASGTRKPDPAKATFGEIAMHYLASGKKRNGEDKAQSTKDLEQHIYEDYLKTQWAERVAKNIEPLKIQEWLDSFKRELADTTRAKIRNVMSAIYRTDRSGA